MIFPPLLNRDALVLWAAEVKRVMETTFAASAATMQRRGTPVVLASFDKAHLPPPTLPVTLIVVTDDAGGLTPAFNDGTNWRRTSDRAPIS